MQQKKAPIVGLVIADKTIAMIASRQRTLGKENEEGSELTLKALRNVESRC